jgi:hypothetical protein
VFPGSGEAPAERRSVLGGSTFGAPDVMNDSFMTPDALNESFMTSETAQPSPENRCRTSTPPAPSSSTTTAAASASRAAVRSVAIAPPRPFPSRVTARGPVVGRRG